MLPVTGEERERSHEKAPVATPAAVTEPPTRTIIAANSASPGGGGGPPPLGTPLGGEGSGLGVGEGSGLGVGDGSGATSPPQST